MAEVDRKFPMRRTVGMDIRRLREQCGLPQQEISALLGLLGRDAMSKMERGINNLTIVDYLEIMWFLRDIEPDHPGVALAQYYRRRQRAEERAEK